MRTKSDVVAWDKVATSKPVDARPASSDAADAPVSLQRLLPLVRFFQCDDVPVRAMAASVASATAGDLVCFQSGFDDPIAFSAAAMARGASAIVTEQLLPCPLPQAIVGDAEDAAARIAAALHGDPASKLLTIGIAGASGKTSTAVLVAGLLKKLGIRTAYETDLGSSDGVVPSSSDAAPARGVALVERVAEARDAGCAAIVIDLSGPHPGAGQAVPLDILVITGTEAGSSAGANDDHFGPDPLTHALDLTRPDTVVVLPSDCPKLARRAADSGLRRLSYGLRRPADVSAQLFDEQPGETTLMVSVGDETAALSSWHSGQAGSLNALAAISVGLLLETPLTEAIDQVASLPMIPGRMQRLAGLGCAAVVIDAAGSPQRLATALRSLRRQRGRGKLWCVMNLQPAGDLSGQPSQRDSQLAQSGRLLEALADRVVLTASDQDKPHFLAAAHGVLDGFQQVATARLVADQKRAIRWAIRHAAPEDTVLLITGQQGTTVKDRRRCTDRIERLVELARLQPDVRRQEPVATIPLPWTGSTTSSVSGP